MRRLSSLGDIKQALAPVNDRYADQTSGSHLQRLEQIEPVPLKTLSVSKRVANRHTVNTRVEMVSMSDYLTIAVTAGK